MENNQNTSFEVFDLDARIQSAVRALGFTTPTPIQAQAIPAVLTGKDVLGLAQTGTGKTAAFMLPILQRLMDGPRNRVRALVLAPTRELAEQIHQATRDFGKNLHLRSTAIYGGVGKAGQLKALRSGVEIVIACPGRLLDLLGEGQVDLSHVEVFVLDEADRMCDMGFLPDVRRVIKFLPTKRQTLFFSATMPDDARGLAGSILKNPVTVQIGMAAPVRTVSHALYPVNPKQKKEMLLALLNRTATGRVLIFTRTKHRARGLARDLEKMSFRVAMLQGNMSQNKRQQALDGFRGNKFDVLVATDIAARGIDVNEITHVINFDMPDTVDAYTHRIGRTGRMEETGDAFTFMAPEDAPMVRAIEKVLGYRIETRRLEGFAYAEPETAQPPRKNGGGNGFVPPQRRQVPQGGHRGRPSGGRAPRTDRGRQPRSGR
ncbi:MAG TPA: DEAD/DEAH box helicase [Anaerolineales bacterium]|nr:DEAD/DEAH box helicase [Anaerolineales bacterium]